MTYEVNFSERVVRKLDMVDASMASRFYDTVVSLEHRDFRKASSIQLKSALSENGIIYAIRIDERYQLLYELEGDSVTVIDLVTAEDFRRLAGGRS